MIAIVRRLASAFGQRVALWAALILILGSALRIAKRKGRHAAEAEFAIRAAEARIRGLRISREVHHEIEALPAAERNRRLDRWMRD
ncbi:hypothetical protein [Roseicyclus marinus]|uniref:Uncharacterized protein n=1 Tax=Roseicyclus marinus TaxID=2161673 RepID=A0AA48KJR1_9RHOB|nr:hypothetical protein MACH21_26060 [Roseicyclus marinus]